MPPIANYWFKFRWEEAKGWETFFSAQIEAFKVIIGSDVATAKSFNVDCFVLYVLLSCCRFTLKCCSLSTSTEFGFAFCAIYFIMG
ncbi:hypothetical protein RHMOL_Rhmol13G0142500 [Rhododendron molle]|uniref:Uncharacterized protein n=1 Tax=Rhododendron molle TaxID=49168 RepID=A0ACC0L7M7_RHOML|nr:hypothetical protein RHMOL_Rhmol13G0142500 [Rhododendron molle]